MIYLKKNLSLILVILLTIILITMVMVSYQQKVELIDQKVKLVKYFSLLSFNNPVD